MEYARNVFAPEINPDKPTVQAAVFVACIQSPLFTWHHTDANCPLSVAVPLATNNSLLTEKPFLGELIATPGFIGSVKFAVSVRFDRITNVTVAELVSTSPLQLTKSQPAPGCAVIE